MTDDVKLAAQGIRISLTAVEKAVEAGDGLAASRALKDIDTCLVYLREFAQMRLVAQAVAKAKLEVKP